MLVIAGQAAAANCARLTPNSDARTAAKTYRPENIPAFRKPGHIGVPRTVAKSSQSVRPYGERVLFTKRTQ